MELNNKSNNNNNNNSENTNVETNSKENKIKLVLNSVATDKNDISKSNKDYLSLLDFGVHLAKSFVDNRRKIVVLLPTLYETQYLYDILSDYLEKEEVNLFVADEVLRISSASTSKEMLIENINSLASTFDENIKNIIVMNATGAIQTLCSKEIFKNHILNFKVNDTLNRTKLIETLTSSGYRRVNRIESIGDFVVRGMVIDIYSPNYEQPIRINLFDDEIEDIKFFDLESERSFKFVDEVKVVPYSLHMITSSQLELGINRIHEEVSKKSYYSSSTERYVNLIKDGVSSLFLEDEYKNLFPYFSIRTEDPDKTEKLMFNQPSVFDYLSNYEMISFSSRRVEDQIEHYYLEESNIFLELQNNKQALKEERMYVKQDLFNIHQDQFLRIETDLIEDEVTTLSLVESSTSSKTDGLVPPPYICKSLSEFKAIVTTYFMEKTRVNICLTGKSYDTLLQYLDENEIKYKECNVDDKVENESEFREVVYTYKLQLSNPIYDKGHKLVFLNNSSIFGNNIQRSSFLSRYKEAKVIKKFEDLNIGDYVVHEKHGIGIYSGITLMKGLEYLKITYAKEQTLFVPLNQFRFLRKYASRDGYVPTLDTFDGSSWERRKNKIRSKMAFMADQLLNLAAVRSTIKGYSFYPDYKNEMDFDRKFPYMLTNAQKRVLDEVYADMEKDTPMDRLVTGDVGFGKTEIAFRAAYRVVLHLKQVAFLCPTTILAKQHYDLALKRFEGTDVKICCLTRLIKKAEVDKLIRKIKNHEIDIVIGTHKILSQDVVFDDLGLLVVDEEQRFGVVHKEKIKSLTTKVDCLTLTATPIPRTLELSILDIKAVSLIDEAPSTRIPIKTYVCQKDNDLIKEVIYRELGRKGQVFYLYNSIERMNDKFYELSKMFPRAKIEMAHGQLASEVLEDRMDNFYNGQTDILLCTTIIESGLDVPRANTIIVEDAQNFGLAQLYQIKGRVGRSDKLAYCYYMYSKGLQSDSVAFKRLEALKNFTELGSGYKIASQDLQIRGAGDILGKNQSGHIDSIGYDSYNRLLKDVIKEQKFYAEYGQDATYQHDSESLFGTNKDKYILSFTLDAIVPISFASSSERITIYRELSNISSIKEIDEFKAKLIDIYGQIPQEVNNLLIKRKVEIMLNSSSSIITDFVESLSSYKLEITKQYLNDNGEKFMNTFMDKSESIIKHLKIYINRFGNLVIEFTRTNNYLEVLYTLLNNVYLAYLESMKVD